MLHHHKGKISGGKTWNILDNLARKALFLLVLFFHVAHSLSVLFKILQVHIIEPLPRYGTYSAVFCPNHYCSVNGTKSWKRSQSNENKHVSDYCSLSIRMIPPVSLSYRSLSERKKWRLYSEDSYYNIGPPESVPVRSFLLIAPTLPTWEKSEKRWKKWCETLSLNSRPAALPPAVAPASLRDIRRAHIFLVHLDLTQP